MSNFSQLINWTFSWLILKIKSEKFFCSDPLKERYKRQFIHFLHLITQQTCRDFYLWVSGIYYNFNNKKENSMSLILRDSSRRERDVSPHRQMATAWPWSFTCSRKAATHSLRTCWMSLYFFHLRNNSFFSIWLILKIKIYKDLLFKFLQRRLHGAIFTFPPSH